MPVMGRRTDFCECVWKTKEPCAYLPFCSHLLVPPAPYYMIVTGTLRFVWGLVASLLLASGVLMGEESAAAVSDAGGDGALGKIVWGEHWAGPALKDAHSLGGKVVLLQIWGGCDGCRSVTPGLVELARKHGDRPFHLIASYCQQGEREATIEFLKSNGWSEEIANLSVMHQTRYAPEIEIAHAPYYLLFDHTGKLRHHHVSGPYHGGNGDKYQELVAQLLEEIPDQSAPAPQALSDLRSWANAQGKLIEASLLGVSNGRAKFQMRNGCTYEYPLEKLSEESRREISELVDK